MAVRSAGDPREEAKAEGEDETGKEDEARGPARSEHAIVSF